MSESVLPTVRVYVNGRGVDVTASGTAIDAVRLLEPDEARRIEAGERGLADSRGIPCAPSTAVHGGAIFRIISGRAARGGDA